MGWTLQGASRAIRWALFDPQGGVVASQSGWYLQLCADERRGMLHKLFGQRPLLPGRRQVREVVVAVQDAAGGLDPVVEKYGLRGAHLQAVPARGCE